MRIDDSARPRYLPLTRDRRLEVDYPLDNPTRPAALTVVDRDGNKLEDDADVIRLARRLSRYRYSPRTVVAALSWLCGYAVTKRAASLAADHAARNVAVAEECDAVNVDAPIPFVVVEREPDDGTQSVAIWESCFGNDPEAPRMYLDGSDIDDFARSEQPYSHAVGAL